MKKVCLFRAAKNSYHRLLKYNLWVIYRRIGKNLVINQRQTKQGEGRNLPKRQNMDHKKTPAPRMYTHTGHHIKKVTFLSILHIKKVRFKKKIELNVFFKI